MYKIIDFEFPPYIKIIYILKNVNIINMSWLCLTVYDLDFSPDVSPCPCCAVSVSHNHIRVT